VPQWLSRYLSVDDLWSVVGYGLFLGVSRLQSPALSLPSVSMLASGMLAIYWLASPNLRQRNLERRPLVRVVFWALVAAVSAVGVVK
jgi:hypothetical protein